MSVVVGGNAGCSIRFNTRALFDEWERIKKRSRNAGSYYVRMQAKKVLQKLAYATPISEKTKIHYKTGKPSIIKARGRARAGWWPAANVLGVTNVYTPVANKGEGSVVDRLNDPINPMIVMTNAVPYITEIAGKGTDWAEAAVREVEANAKQYLEESWKNMVQGVVAG